MATCLVDAHLLRSSVVRVFRSFCEHHQVRKRFVFVCVFRFRCKCASRCVVELDGDVESAMGQLVICKTTFVVIGVFPSKRSCGVLCVRVCCCRFFGVE